MLTPTLKPIKPNIIRHGPDRWFKLSVLSSVSCVAWLSLILDENLWSEAQDGWVDRRIYRLYNQLIHGYVDNIHRLHRSRPWTIGRSEETPSEVAAASLVPKLSRTDYYSNPSIDPGNC